jgi:hypothetical protein
MNNLICKKLGIAVISGCLMTWVGIAQAAPGSAFGPAPLVVFSNGNIADADDVNANFNELENRIEIITHTAGKTGKTGKTGNRGKTGKTGPAGADSTVAGPTGPAGADSTVAGPTGPAGLGLGTVVFNFAPKVTDDMKSHTVGTVWIDTSGPTAYILVDNTYKGAVWTALGGPATGSLYAIGDTGPAGGFVFYVTDDGLHGLEAAPEDIGGNASAELVAWGCYGVSQRDLCNEQTTAATSAAAYVHNGYDDWFLPSKDELNLMYENLADSDSSNTNSGPEDPNNVGGFANDYYWSSTQRNLYNAWSQYFGFGDQNADTDKYGTLRVRAVRAF